MISVAELTERFGPSVPVAPWGDCLVVGGVDFNPDWEAELGDQGFRCHFGTLDNRAVTFVQLKRSVAPGKVVYVPPKPVDPAAAVAVSRVDWSSEEDAFLIELWKSGLGIHEISLSVAQKFSARRGNAVKCRLDRLKASGRIVSRWKNAPGNEVKEMDKTEEKKNLNNFVAEKWPKKDADELLSLYDAAVKKANRKYGVKRSLARELAFSGRFSGRSADGIEQKIEKLVDARNHRKIRDNPQTSIEVEKSPETSKVETEKAPAAAERIHSADVLVDLVMNYQILSEANEKLNSAYVELREDFEAYSKMQSEISEVHRKELSDLEAGLVSLRGIIGRHKHAVSGEAMLPLEASK